MALNEKQKLFIDEYMLSFNAADAYFTVYDCDRDNARKHASRLLTSNDDVRSEVQKRMKDFYEKKHDQMLFKKEFVIYELFGHSIDPRAKRNDRIKALELLGKHFALFTEKIETRDKTLEENPMYQQLKEMTNVFKNEDKKE